MKKILVLASLLAFASCTDATWSSLTALGTPARITCYSGGVVFYDACSTGKIADSQGSDGYILDDALTHRHVQVAGQCLIDYAAPCPTERVQAQNFQKECPVATVDLGDPVIVQAPKKKGIR